MKKFLTIIISMVLVLSLNPCIVFATEPQEASTRLEYELDGSFMCSIPATVNVGDQFEISCTDYNIASNRKLSVYLQDNLNERGYVELQNDDGSNIIEVRLESSESGQLSCGNCYVGDLENTEDTITMYTDVALTNDNTAGSYYGNIIFDISVVDK